MKGLLVGVVIGAVGMHCISDGKKSMIKKGKEVKTYQTVLLIFTFEKINDEYTSNSEINL